MEPIIDIANLNVTYFPGQKHEVQALRDVSLSIYPGEFIIFFGPSGCGKSTLLYSIAGLESRAAGKINVNGHDVHNLRAASLAQFRQREIGMIFQAFYLINSLSVIANVTLPQVAVGVSPLERTRRASELLKHFGVEAQARKLPNELSGGQQQRVAICRALINEPAIVLADEPVGNLDSRSSAEVIHLIQDLNRTQGKTVILVTHDPAHLAIAHRVFSMQDGRIVKVTVNRAVNEVVKQPKTQHTTSKDLELLQHSFPDLTSTEAATALATFQAHEITTEVLTNLSTGELRRIEGSVAQMLREGSDSRDNLFGLLDRPPEDGGVGLDRRTAARLADRVAALVAEVRQLRDEERRHRVGVPKEVTELRRYLVETFSLTLSQDAVRAFDLALHDRLKNVIDVRGLRIRLDNSLEDGGVGLDRRVARNVARQAELLVLEKWKGPTS